MADLPYCGGVSMLWATKVTLPFSESGKERVGLTRPSETTLKERAHWVG